MNINFPASLAGFIKEEFFLFVVVYEECVSSGIEAFSIHLILLWPKIFQMHPRMIVWNTETIEMTFT